MFVSLCWGWSGKIVDLWVGRYWGASRAVQSEKLYASTNVKAVRILRKWAGKQLGQRSFAGSWLLLDDELRQRVMILCDDLDHAEIPWHDEVVRKSRDLYRVDVVKTYKERKTSDRVYEDVDGLKE